MAANSLWLSGEILSVVALAAGAVLSLLETEPFVAWRGHRSVVMPIVPGKVMDSTEPPRKAA